MAKKENQKEKSPATVSWKTAIIAARMLGSVDMTGLDGKSKVAVTRAWLGVNEHAALYDRKGQEAIDRLTTEEDRELLSHVDDSSDPQRQQAARQRSMELNQEAQEAVSPTLAEEVELTWPTLDAKTLETLIGANAWTTYQIAALMEAVGADA